MTRTLAHVAGMPYSIERRTFARVPCLVERPSLPIRALLVAYHGSGAAKEGKLGVYSALTARGVAIIIPDAPLHGDAHSTSPASTTVSSSGKAPGAAWPRPRPC